MIVEVVVVMEAAAGAVYVELLAGNQMYGEGQGYMFPGFDLGVGYGLGERFGPLVKNGQTVDHLE